MSSGSVDRAAVRRLRHGIVPTSHVLRLSVGLERSTTVVSAELKGLAEGNSRACFIQGEWGTGKTHFLAVVRSLVKKRGLASAYLNLNGNSAALNQPQRFYHLIATRLQVGDVGPGLNAIIEHWRADPIKCQKLSDWAIANAGRSDLAAAILGVLAGLPLATPWEIVMGADLASSDSGRKRDKALKRIDRLGDCLNFMGCGGLVLALDEAEMLEQLWNSRSRIGAYSTLGYLVSMKSVLPIFAVTARFERQIEDDIRVRNILANRFLSIPAVQFLSRWRKGEFPKITPTMVTPGLAEVLVDRIVELYQGAYGLPTDRPNVTELVDSWSESPTRNARNLIRGTVHVLDVARDGLG